MSLHQDLRDCVGFQWDEGNSDKNLEKHGITDEECEEVFFNQPLLVGEDEEHSQDEPRGYVLGQTSSGRRLFLVFTVRNQLVRIISAREMTPAESKRYMS